MDQSEFRALWTKSEQEMETASGLVTDERLAEGFRCILVGREEWPGERTPFFILTGFDEEGKEARLIGRASLLGQLTDQGWTDGKRWIGTIKLLGKSAKGAFRYSVKGTVLEE